MKPTMHQLLAVAGFTVLCVLTFYFKDNNARGVLLGASSSAIGFYTGASSPMDKRKT